MCTRKAWGAYSGVQNTENKIYIILVDLNTYCDIYKEGWSVQYLPRWVLLSVRFLVFAYSSRSPLVGLYPGMCPEIKYSTKLFWHITNNYGLLPRHEIKQH